MFKNLEFRALCEPDAFRQHLSLVQNARSIFENTSKKLEAEKADLFKSGYSEKWQVAQDFDASRAKDRNYAFKNMLPSKKS